MSKTCSSIIREINNLPSRIEIYRILNHPNKYTLEHYYKVWFWGNKIMYVLYYSNEPSVSKIDFERYDITDRYTWLEGILKDPYEFTLMGTVSYEDL